jgi:iron complex outermembrane receptor protein
LDFLLSATRFDSQGENRLYFPEFDSPENNNGITSHSAFETAERLFGRLAWQHFTFMAGYSKRVKGLPLGNYGSVFNAPRNQNGDQDIFLNLTYDNKIADNLALYVRAYHGRYDYPGIWTYDDPPLTIYEELGLSRWWGTETRLVSTHFSGHKLMLGAEFQDNFHLSNTFVPINPPDPSAAVGFNESTKRYGLYLQDELTLRDDLILNIGLRYDYLSYASDALNPRLALIYHPWDNTVFKLLYGSSFRAPNANELYYSDPITQPGTNLNPEHIKTYEAIIEHQPNKTLRLTTAGFHYEMDNLIQLQNYPDSVTGEEINQFVNTGVSKAWGAEFEAEKLWDAGQRLRASYTYTHAYDASNNQKLINSASNLLKVNFSTPIFKNSLRTGIEAQYTDSRKGRDGSKSDGYPLFNLTLTSGEKLFGKQLKGLEISGSAYNLLDQRYNSVASDEFVQHLIPQNGRNFRFVFSYQF